MRYLILALAFAVQTACWGQTTTDIATDLQEILNKASEREDLAGISMAVYAPGHNINWTGAAGFDSLEKDNALKAEQPFRIASVTKSFASASILRLMEEGKLNLDDPISKHISPDHIEILKSDGYDPNAITIRHCLQHRGGLFDYALAGDAYINAALENPDKRWTRTEQLQFAIDHGAPLGDPGKVYGYSDTGYILLGEIVEKRSGKGLAEAMRSLLDYEGLALEDTWLESLEARGKNKPDVVHRYLETIDATQWDNSVDLYGGGGLAATCEDLTRFYYGLFNGSVFNRPETLTTMLEDAGPAEMKGGPRNYRMGIWEIDLYGHTGYMHSGFWGTYVVHIPDWNTAIAINYTNNASGTGVLKQTLEILSSVIGE